MDNLQITFEPLIELRNNALLMSLANAHLCEDVFLVKIGRSIKENVLALKADISELKKAFPGKFVTEVDTDGVLKKINDIADIMLEPVDEIREKCVIGELGREMEADVESVTSAVRQIRTQVFGRDVVYTRKDSVSRLFSGIRNFGSLLGGAALKGLKILCVILIIAIPVFLYLFFTMDKEEKLLNAISANDSRISSQQDMIRQLDIEKIKISGRIESLLRGETDREGKIAILDLEMEVHRINEDRQKAEAEIEGLEAQNAGNRQKIDYIRNVPFVERILRIKR